MPEVSNKSLAFLLVGAIILSLFGTMISLGRLGKIAAPPIITGQATSGQGTASVNIASMLNIMLVTSAIDFGTCYPNTSRTAGYADRLDSNDTSEGGVSDGKCTGLTPNPQNITIRNLGNQDANVTVNIDNNTMTGGSNQSLYFAIVNSSDYPGCYKGISFTWINFTNVTPNANSEYETCVNLSGLNKQYWFFLRLYLPQNPTPGSKTATLTFTAHNSN